MEVIGSGFGRNGTDTLRKALEMLGYGPCHHMAEVIEDPAQLTLWQKVAAGHDGALDEALSGFRAQVDWPGAAYWERLASRYPDARVILSVRDPDEWFDSMQATIVPFIKKMQAQSHDAHLRNLAAWAQELIVEGIFQGRLEDRAHATAVYRAHITKVQKRIAAERLLVYRVTDEWTPLCAFLGRPVPAKPFPRGNSTNEFRENNAV